MGEIRVSCRGELWVGIRVSPEVVPCDLLLLDFEDTDGSFLLLFHDVCGGVCVA